MDKSKMTIDQIFPKSYSIVFFHAHCDDESFLSGGILNQLVRMGRKCTIVYGAAAIVEGEDKTILRQKETIDACSILGIDSTIFLSFCEPKYSNPGAHPLLNQKIENVSEVLWEALLSNNIKPPISFVSYDKNGGYGNKDHKIIHLVGRDVNRKHKKSILFSEITMNRTMISKWLVDAKKRLDIKSLPQLSYWSTEFGLPTKDIQFSYRLTDKQLDLKSKALTIHKSQNPPKLFPLSLNSDDFERVFGKEFIYIP